MKLNTYFAVLALALISSFGCLSLHRPGLLHDILKGNNKKEKSPSNDSGADLIVKLIKNSDSDSKSKTTECSSNLFSPLKVKHFFGSDMACDITSVSFDDPNFPLISKYEGKNVIMMIPEQVYPDNKVSLFGSQIKLDDLNQGDIGDCYFISALVSVATFPSQVLNKFRNPFSENSCLEIALYIDGQWKIVVLDGRIPVDEDNKLKPKPMFINPKSSKLWPILLEKAWAKVRGSYSKIEGGNTADVLFALTGTPTKTFFISEKTEEVIFSEIKALSDAGSVICASTISSITISKEKIVPNHAYTILGLVTLSDNNNLVKLRNPYGLYDWNGEWNGEWSDKAKEWDTVKDSDYSYKRDPMDGIFHIPFSKFIIYFNRVNASMLREHQNVKYLKFKVDKPTLTKPANTEKEYQNFIDNSPPRYFRISVREDGLFTVSAVVLSKLYNDLTDKSLPLRLVFAEVKGKDYFYKQGLYSKDDYISIIENLKKGEYLLWIWYDFKFSSFANAGDKANTVRIAVTSSSEFEISEESKDKDLELLTEIMRSHELIKNIKLSLDNSIFSPLQMEFFYSKRSKNYKLNVKYKSNEFISQVIASYSEIKPLLFFYPDSHFCNFKYEETNLSPKSSPNKSNPLVKLPANVGYTYRTGCLNTVQPFYSFEFADAESNVAIRYKNSLNQLINFISSEKPDSINNRWKVIKSEENVYFGQVNINNQYEGLGLLVENKKLQNNKFRGYCGIWSENEKQKIVEFETANIENSFLKVREGSFTNQKWEGIVVKYSEKGILKSFYTNGIEAGSGTFYLKANQAINKGVLKDGKFIGKCDIFENPKIDKLISWSKGKCSTMS